MICLIKKLYSSNSKNILNFIRKHSHWTDRQIKRIRLIISIKLHNNYMHNFILKDAYIYFVVYKH